MEEVIKVLLNSEMTTIYLAIAAIFGGVVTSLLPKLLKGNVKTVTCVSAIITALFILLAIFSSLYNPFILEESFGANSKDNYSESATETKTDRSNGSTTIIQERNKGNSYDDYDEVKVTSNFNDDFSITNCRTVSISGSHNDGFTISNCESVIVSSHNNSFVIKSCKEVEISGSHCDAIIIIDCPSVKVLDGYNKIYLVNSMLKQDKGKDNQIQKMTVEDLKNSDMGYLVEDN